MPVHVQKIDVPISELGEGPVWSDREKCLYFVDIAAGRLQAYWPETKAYQHWQFDQFTGSLAECRSGGLLVALRDRLVRFDPKAGPSAIETIAVLESDRPSNRLNDGKADPWGRFWVGSMDVNEAAKTGRLWCVTPERKITLHRDGIGVSNSLAFDASREQMYFADSRTRTIETSSLDEGHAPTGFRPFAKAGKGSPDGSCTDADGYLWNAEWGGARVVRYSPDGTVDRVIDMPTSRPSCCAFGGKDYKTLFVTSAHYKMPAEERERDRDAGSLYCIELGDVKGLPSDRFAI